MAEIIEDTRQQVHDGDKHANKHLWWERHGVGVERRKLDFGDYARADGTSNVVVDTKRSLDEVVGNVGRSHDRFVRELDKARNAGCRLVILIEVGAPYTTVDAIARWTSGVCRRCDLYRKCICDPAASGQCRRKRHKPMQGRTLLRIMRSLERDHGCRFEVCHPAHSAARICELLGVEVGT